MNTPTTRSVRVSYTEEFDLDNWLDLVDYLKLMYAGKPFNFNDSRRFKEKLC